MVPSHAFKAYATFCITEIRFCSRRLVADKVMAIRMQHLSTRVFIYNNRPEEYHSWVQNLGTQEVFATPEQGIASAATTGTKGIFQLMDYVTHKCED